MRKYIIDNIELDPIRMGTLGDFDYDCEPNTTCHDCGCAVGEQHSLSCYAERCPACGGQLISCDYNIFAHDEDTGKKQFFEGQRVLLDFMQHFDEKSYMFVGNTNHGFIAIAKER